MAHTPGPWEANSDFRVRTKGGFIVADCDGQTREERKANTILAAAAPDLLTDAEALVGLVEAFLRERKPTELDRILSEGGVDAVGYILQTARADIAKARGK